MALTKEQIYAAALELEPAERERLAEVLMLTLPPVDMAEIDRECLEEAERRYASYKAGQMTTSSVDEVINRILSKRRP